MAKKTQDQAPAPHGESLADLMVTYGPRSVRFGDLPHTSQVHLITLGFSTTLKNSHTGLTGKAAQAAWTAGQGDELRVAVEDLGVDYSTFDSAENFANTVADAQEALMFERLVSGDVHKVRVGGPRKDEVGQIVDQLATKDVLAYAKAKGTLDRITAKKDDPEDVRDAKAALRAKAVGIFKEKNADAYRAAAEAIVAERRKASGATPDGMEDLGI